MIDDTLSPQPIPSLLPYILRLFGRKSSGEQSKKAEICAKKTKFKKNGVGENIDFQGTLFTPEFFMNYEVFCTYLFQIIGNRI